MSVNIPTANTSNPRTVSLHKGKTAVIIGGSIGGVFFLLLTSGSLIAYLKLVRHRLRCPTGKSSPNLALGSVQPFNLLRTMDEKTAVECVVSQELAIARKSPLPVNHVNRLSHHETRPSRREGGDGNLGGVNSASRDEFGETPEERQPALARLQSELDNMRQEFERIRVQRDTLGDTPPPAYEGPEEVPRIVRLS